MITPEQLASMEHSLASAEQMAGRRAGSPDHKQWTSIVRRHRRQLEEARRLQRGEVRIQRKRRKTGEIYYFARCPIRIHSLTGEITEKIAPVQFDPDSHKIHEYCYNYEITGEKDGWVELACEIPSIRNGRAPHVYRAEIPVQVHRAFLEAAGC